VQVNSIFRRERTVKVKGGFLAVELAFSIPDSKKTIHINISIITNSSKVVTV
jgi:hypothetical protein